MEQLDIDEASRQVVPGVEGHVRQVEPRPYDPMRDRERIRGLIAAAMTALFVAVIAILLADALLGRDLDYIAKLAALILTPVSGLLGAVVGFYYGEQSGRR